MTAPGEQELMELENELQSLQIDRANAVGDYEAASRKLQSSIQDIVVKYKTVLSGYTALKKNIGTADQDTGAKSAETGKGRDDYYFFLIDGNSVNFLDELIRANGRGGSQAALRIHDAIKSHVSSRVSNLEGGAENCRLMVRIYADLKSLSHAALTAKIVDPNMQSRALARFAANFSTTYPFFDFIDVKQKHMVKNKVEETFQDLLKDPACKQIFFAVGPVPCYMEMLGYCKARNNKATLVTTGAVHPRYLHCSMSTVEFPDVFQSACRHDSKAPVDLRQEGKVSPKQGSISTETGRGRRNSSRSTTGKRDPRICYKFLNRGQCTWYKCKFTHTLDPDNTCLSSHQVKKEKAGEVIHESPKTQSEGHQDMVQTMETLEVEPLIDLDDHEWTG